MATGLRYPRANPSCRRSNRPYVYSTDELRRLLDATSALDVANSGLKAMYRRLLLLLYGAGLRVGEGGQVGTLDYRQARQSPHDSPHDRRPRRSFATI